LILGTWNTIDHKGEGTKVRLYNPEKWGLRGFQDVIITPNVNNPEYVTGALFMHNNVPYISE
jgi:hypothetical protein